MSTETTARHRRLPDSTGHGLVRDVRHQSTQEKLRWFDAAHLPEGLPREVAEATAEYAAWLEEHLKDGPQLAIALQHLIETKDAAVRQALSDAGIVE